MAVREFRSGLEEISSGQFRDIERELMGEAVTPPLVAASSLTASERPSLVVGDPLSEWPSESALPAVEDKRAQSTPSPVATNPAMEVDRDGGGDAGLGGNDARGTSEATNAVHPSSWAPPATERESQFSSQPANWYPVGELKTAPEVSSVPLKSAVRKQSEDVPSSAPIPPAILDAWYNLPPADGRSSPPLN